MMTKPSEDLDARSLLEKWEARAAAIEAELAELRPGISILRRTLGLRVDTARVTPTPVAGGSASGSRDHDDDASKPYLGMNVLEAARLFLARRKEPRSPTDIADALRRGGVHSKSDDFAGVIRTTLSRKGGRVGIENFGGGKWGLSEWRPGRARPTGAEDNEPGN